MGERSHSDHTWTIDSGETESNELDLRERPLAGLIFTVTPTGTTFTFKVRTKKMVDDGVAAVVKQGSDYQVEVSAPGAYHIPPEVLAYGFVTLVSDGAEAADRTIYVGSS